MEFLPDSVIEPDDKTPRYTDYVSLGTDENVPDASLKNGDDEGDALVAASFRARIISQVQQRAKQMDFRQIGIGIVVMFVFILISRLLIPARVVSSANVIS